MLDPAVLALISQLQRVQQQVQPALELQRQLQPGLVELARQAQAIVDQAQAAFEPIRQLQPGLDALRELWRLSTPDNWQDLDSEELHNVIDLVEESRICLVWAPRAGLLRELLAEPDDVQRIELLGRSFDVIVEDMRTVLSTVIVVDNVEGHGAALAFASEALAAAADGHVHAAQALAASGLGAVLHDVWGYPLLRGLGQARREFSDQDLNEAVVRAVKWTLIQLCTAKALTNTTEGIPGYNRHGTQHGVRRYFSAANSGESLLLLVAWVKEISWMHKHYPEAFASDNDLSPATEPPTLS